MDYPRGLYAPVRHTFKINGIVMLSIQTFGPMRLFFDRKELPLPASRKTRALLGYLALSGTAQRRER